MHTGISSVANLADMGAVYPFSGYEWLYALILLGFTIYFVASQISMDKNEAIEASTAALDAPPASLLPAE